jgi:hypothetical protein
MRPQDIVILLKIICYGNTSWYSKTLASDLSISTAEISLSLNRSVNAGLLDTDKKKVRKQALSEFIVHGLQYVFPLSPGAVSRGLPTALSHPFMKTYFAADQQYVWPDAESDERGLSIQPLYAGAVCAAKKDQKLYLMLALIDVLRSGKTRERKLATEELQKQIDQ